MGYRCDRDLGEPRMFDSFCDEKRIQEIGKRPSVLGVPSKQRSLLSLQRNAMIAALIQ